MHINTLSIIMLVIGFAVISLGIRRLAYLRQQGLANKVKKHRGFRRAAIKGNNARV